MNPIGKRKTRRIQRRDQSQSTARLYLSVTIQYQIGNTLPQINLTCSIQMDAIITDQIL